MISERLKQAIQKKGLTIAGLSRLTRISDRHIRRLTHPEGKRGSSLETIETLAVALEVSPGWLAFGEDKIEVAL